MQISSNLIIKNIDKGTIRFNSDTTSVATIDSNGLLSIHGVGTATITAKRSIDSASAIELNATLSLTVTKGNQAPLAFEKIALSTGFIEDSTKSNVASGGTGNGEIIYSIDYTKVATIHPNTGIVTIKGRGTAKVTATKASDANYNSISNSYELTVNNKQEQPLLRFTRNEITLDYQAGGLRTTNTVTDGGAGNGAITYRSDNDKVATVDNNGVVTIKRAGTLRIRATKAGDADYNPTEASYILTVNKIAQSDFSFAKDVVTVAYEANKKISNPVQGGSGSGAITYEIDNENIAMIDGTNGEVTLKSTGTATITATRAGDDNYHPTSATYSIEIVSESSITFTLGIKHINFAWSGVVGTDHYRLLADLGKGGGFPDASTRGFVVVPNSNNIKQTTARADIALHRYIPLVNGPQYRVEACDAGNDCYSRASVSLNNAQLNELIGYFKASNTGAGDSFGYSVSISGDGNTLAVGAVSEGSAATGVNGDENNNNKSVSGAVYVFVRNSSITQWEQQAYIKASNSDFLDLFSHSVSLSGNGNTLAVGAITEAGISTGVNGDESKNSKIHAGAVYVFTRSGSTWIQQAYIKASNTDSGDNFGGSVSLSGDGNSLAVGAVREDSDSTGVGGGQGNVKNIFDAGAVYVFTRNGSTWSQQAYIKASNTGEGDLFGQSVSLSDDGNSLAVGTPEENSSSTGVDSVENNNSTDTGAVYVFVRDSGSQWTQQAYIKASNTGKDDEFGYAVSISGDGNSLAVGAIKEDSDATGVDGEQNNSSATDSGAVYVFTRSSDTWSQQAYIKASNSGAGDEFGYAVSLSGDGNSLAVGTRYEDSNAEGISSGAPAQDKDDGKHDNSGAVYFFTRSGEDWNEQAYIKASNTGADDEFGSSVSISDDGNSLAVGAPDEQSNSTGIGGAQDNDGANKSGAVYLY